MSLRKYEVAKWWKLGAAYGFMGCSYVPDAPKDSVCVAALNDGWRWARLHPDTDFLNAFLQREGLEPLHMVGISNAEITPMGGDTANTKAEGRDSRTLPRLVGGTIHEEIK